MNPMGIFISFSLAHRRLSFNSAGGKVKSSESSSTSTSLTTTSPCDVGDGAFRARGPSEYVNSFGGSSRLSESLLVESDSHPSATSSDGGIAFGVQVGILSAWTGWTGWTWSTSENISSFPPNSFPFWKVTDRWRMPRISTSSCQEVSILNQMWGQKHHLM